MPTPLQFDLPDYQTNESLKAFDSTDALAKAYIDLDTKVKSGSIELLPEELRKDPSVSPFKNLTDLTKGFVETKKMVGGIKKAPDTADGYKFTAVENVHPNLKADVIQKSIMGIAHKAGIPNESADIVQKEILTMLSNTATQQQKAREELAAKNETTLRGKWAADYDKNFDLVFKTLIKAGGADAIAETDKVSAALKGSPKLLETLHSVFSLLSEDSIGRLGDGPGEKVITDKTKAQERINEIIKMDGNPVMNTAHPEHKKISDEWNSLQAIIGKD